MRMFKTKLAVVLFKTGYYAGIVKNKLQWGKELLKDGFSSAINFQKEQDNGKKCEANK